MFFQPFSRKVGPRFDVNRLSAAWLRESDTPQSGPYSPVIRHRPIFRPPPEARMFPSLLNERLSTAS